MEKYPSNPPVEMEGPSPLGPPLKARRTLGHRARLLGHHSAGQEGSLLPFVSKPEGQGARGGARGPGSQPLL